MFPQKSAVALVPFNLTRCLENQSSFKFTLITSTSTSLPLSLHPHPAIDSQHITIMASQPANLADPVLLEKIDKFFELGIGEYVALPQVSSTPL